MKAYLDNGATTIVSESVVEKMNQAFTEVYGNPSSMHHMGVEAEKMIKQSKKIIAKCIKGTPEEILFTSGGTEANNLAIQGFLNHSSCRKKEIITSEIEHPSVLSVFQKYEESGYKVIYLKVNDKGLISLSDLEEALSDETALVSIMHVNNEIGTIQDLSAISKLLKRSLMLFSMWMPCKH